MSTTTNNRFEDPQLHLSGIWERSSGSGCQRTPPLASDPDTTHMRCELGGFDGLLGVYFQYVSILFSALGNSQWDTKYRGLTELYRYSIQYIIPVQHTLYRYLVASCTVQQTANTALVL
jgi:hypothetical protein